MKRWPILVSFVLFVGLCASATFWGMQLFKPVVRPVAFPKPSTKTEVDPEAALGLFGGRAAPAAVASNFQLRGVVVAKNPLESVAILAADSKPAEAVRVNFEIMPGVTVKEVHSQYVLLSDGGVMKRVELPEPTPQPIGIVQPTAAAPNLAPPPPPAPQNQNWQDGQPPSPNSPTPPIGHLAGRKAH